MAGLIPAMTKKGYRSITLKLLGALRAGEAVEHAIRQPRLLAAEKRVSERDIFAQRHARRDVGAVRQLIGPSLEDQTQYGFEPVQRPFVAQRGGNRLVEPLAMPRDPAHDVGEQLLIGLAIGLAVDLATEPV